ncbi:MAG TPA: polysaccharide biosynthesis C-terminal domain-containing protein [Candidatus Limnocylindria bacterium]|nr:polysaccharide biosynthesis C-terminal domain-containing protein [Candidatus Limnocylindria bacterium]
MADENVRQIRGSTLLLAGRVIAIVINLAVQVLIVRYLDRTAYGSFAYALSLASILETASTVGLDRSVARYVPLFHERGESARALGTILTVILAIVAIGSAAAAIMVAGRELLPLGDGGGDARGLILIMVALGPLQALDHLFENVLASFGQARSIVLRRHLLGPGLKLAAVVAVISVSADVQLLAILYVAAALAGILLYGPLLLRTLRGAGILTDPRAALASTPFLELLAFSLPLLAIDLAIVARTALDAVFVEHFRGAAEVAALRSVQPVARLNQLVFSSFTILFTPMASRLVARNDVRGLEELYWHSAIWQALVTFPVFALTFSLAGPIAVLLFGSRYADAGPVLAVLAVGYYLNAATGQNAMTLRVYGRVRVLVVGALITAVGTILIDLALIPALGALGAAIAAAAALAFQNGYNQVALHLTTPVHGIRRRHLVIYAAILLAGAALLVVQLAVRPPLPVAVLLVAAVSVGLIAAFRGELEVAATFPELARLPLIGRLLT